MEKDNKNYEHSMEVEAGKKLISEFMGGEVGYLSVLFKEPPKINSGHNQKLYHIDDIAYYTSWDWLMPVVDKIGNLTIPKGFVSEPWPTSIHYGIGKVATIFTIGDNSLFITDSGIQEDGVNNLKEWKNTEKTSLERTWMAVVEFIKWHNTKN